jgi:glycosyltransferase involved in cell wall biosynthesis
MAQNQLFPNPKRPFFASRLYYLSFVLQVSNHLRKQGCDIIHIHNFVQYASLIRAFVPQAKIVLQMHCEWLSQLDPSMLRPHMEKVDAIITPSDFVTEQVRDRFPRLADACYTIPYGVDTGRFCPGADQPPGKRLLFVGRLSPEKGIHVLLDAFARVASCCPDVELDLVGPELFPGQHMVTALSDDPLTQRVGSIASGYHNQLHSEIDPAIADRVRFWGAVPNCRLVKFYRQASVFIFPSVWNEPFGIPVVEAMSVGVPVVATCSGGIPEIVDPGRTGLLVPRDDPAELANAILSLIQNAELARKMGQEGRLRALQLYSCERVIEKTLQVYRKVAAEGSVQAQSV